MATVTTNFGWDIPQSTDLVKDGATAIAALGQDIDTSLVDLKGGTTGQVLAKASNTDMDFTWATDASGIPATIFDAKGDLIAASAADTAARLAVGTNGQVLTADSTTSTGLKWATAAAGSLTKIRSTTMTNVASQDFQSVFTSTYRSYIVEFSQLWSSNPGGATLNAEFYSNTSTAYTDGIRGGFLQITTSGTSSTGFGMSSGYVASMATVPEEGGKFAGGNWNVSNSQSQWSGGYGGLKVTGHFQGGTQGSNSNWVGGFSSTNNTAITGFKIYGSAGNLNGIVTVYGLEN